MFPFSSEIELAPDVRAHYSVVIEKIGPLLTESRRQKIESVVKGRNFSNPVVLEGIYDRGNISAVMRTAEALGFVNFHVIELQEKFKEANRVTQGADKWVEVKKWKSTKSCIETLKNQGYRVCATCLEGSKPIAEIDFSRPTALVLGNEKDGISKEMMELCDERVILPMQGFVQSFNISVAGALCLYHISRARMRGTVDLTSELASDQSSDLTPTQQDILKAIYFLRSLDSGADYLRTYLSRMQK